MDTIANICKIYKQSHLRLFIFTILLTTLTGCPGEIECDGGIIMNSTTIENLSTITPFNNNYNIGDEVTYSLIIPSTNNYFNVERNIFNETKTNYGLLIMESTKLLDSNEVTFIKGANNINGNTNWFHLHFNPLNNNYELIFKVKLNKTGNYNFRVREEITFTSNDPCGSIYLNTSTQGHNANYFINFTVN